jgi:hypothetical protein
MTVTSLYRTLMGSAFSRLDPAVQAFHTLQGHQVLEGRVLTERPASPAARLLARCIRTPLNSSEGPIRFELQAEACVERWTRHFPSDTMTSTLALKDGVLTEHLGLARLSFTLAESEGRLVMRLTGMTFLGVPCPRWALPRIVAKESGSGDRINFIVRAALPGIGQVTGYRGYLQVPHDAFGAKENGHREVSVNEAISLAANPGKDFSGSAAAHRTPTS